MIAATERTTRTDVTHLLAPAPAAATLFPPVIDKRALQQSIARAFELGLALEKRFELVLAGRGRRVDGLPSVELARTVRVGDGTLAGALGNMTKRALLFATPASLVLLTAFGASGVSDLALVIAGIAPFTCVPVAAIRSVRAERAAKRDIERAAMSEALPDDMRPIESFVRQVAGYKDPRLDTVARAVIDQWIERSIEEKSIVPTTADRLRTIRDDLPASTPEIAALGQRLLILGRLARSLSTETKIVDSHVDILRHTLAGCTGAERDAVAAPLRRMLARHSQLLSTLPSAPQNKQQPFSVTFVTSKANAT